MSKISIMRTLFFFLLVGIEHINASSNNLRKRKATVTATSFIDILSSILMKEDWSCCDGTNEPTAVPTVTVDIPTPISSSSPTLSVTSTPTTLRPTSIPTLTPTSSPTYAEKKLTASDDTDSDLFGASCSMSGDLIVICAHYSGDNYEGAAYLYHLKGDEVSKLTAGDDAQSYIQFGYSVSMDETIVIGTFYSRYVQVFSLEGNYERTITCDDCSMFGEAVGTYGEKIVISGYENSSNKIFIYTTKGELLKTIDNGNDLIYDVDISDEAIVFTSGSKTGVYSNSDPDFEEIFEIQKGGYVVSTSGDRIVIGNRWANNKDGNAWLYETDGTFIRTLDHDGQYFGSSVDITDDKIIVGANYDNEGGNNAGSVFIYSAATGTLEKKVLAPDGEVNAYFGNCVSASDSYFVVGAYGDNDGTGAAYIFPLAD